MKSESRIKVAKVLSVILALLGIYSVVGVCLGYSLVSQVHPLTGFIFIPLVIISFGVRTWGTALLFKNPTEEAYTQAGKLVKCSFWLNVIAMLIAWKFTLICILATMGKGDVAVYPLSVIYSFFVLFVLNIAMMIVMKPWKMKMDGAKLSKKSKLIASVLSACLIVVVLAGGLIINYNNINNSDAFKSFKSNNIVTGEAVDQDILKGKTTIVNIWATWCNPCKNEMPDMAELAEKYKDSNVQFIGICQDSQIDKDSNGPIAELSTVQTLIDELGVSYVNLQPDEDFEVDINKICGGTFPTTCVVDENGQILEKFNGDKDKSEWERLIKKYLEN